MGFFEFSIRSLRRFHLRNYCTSLENPFLHTLFELFECNQNLKKKERNHKQAWVDRSTPLTIFTITFSHNSLLFVRTIFHTSDSQPCAFAFFDICSGFFENIWSKEIIIIILYQSENTHFIAKWLYLFDNFTIVTTKILYEKSCINCLIVVKCQRKSWAHPAKIIADVSGVINPKYDPFWSLRDLYFSIVKKSTPFRARW